MKNIIFLAPPAAGKGTLSKHLEKYGYQHISTGKLLREKIQKNDSEANMLKELMKKGNLIDDAKIFDILKEKLKTLSMGEYFILDGVPRTLQQAIILDTILQNLNFSDTIVINIHVEKEVLQKRLTGRRICTNCQNTYNVYFEEFRPHIENICDKCGSLLTERIDDNKDSFTVRYEIFEKNNQEIVNYYQKRNCLYEVSYNEDIVKTLKEIQRIAGAFGD